MEIRQLTDAAEKQAVTRLILEALPEWFGIPEAREAYIRESAGRIFFCAYDRNRPVGFLYLKERETPLWSCMSWAFGRSITAEA